MLVLEVQQLKVEVVRDGQCQSQNAELPCPNVYDLPYIEAIYATPLIDKSTLAKTHQRQFIENI